MNNTPYAKNSKVKLKRPFWGHPAGASGRISAVGPHGKDYVAKLKLKGSPPASLRANDDLVETASALVSRLLEDDFESRPANEVSRFKERDPSGLQLTPEQQASVEKWYGELVSAVRSAYEDQSVYMFFVYQAMSGILKDIGWPNEKAHLIRDYLLQRLDDDKVQPYVGGAHQRFLNAKDRPSKKRTPKPKGWMAGDSAGMSGGVL